MLKTTSAKRQPPRKPKAGERISMRTLGYIRGRNKNAAHSLLLDTFADSGLTKAELADILGKDRGLISRWLGGTGNLTLDTLSDLIFASSGHVLEVGTKDLNEGGKSNHQAIAGYQNIKVRTHEYPTYKMNAPVRISSEKRSEYVKF